jgi:hypothetical protein
MTFLWVFCLFLLLQIGRGDYLCEFLGQCGTVDVEEHTSDLPLANSEDIVDEFPNYYVLMLRDNVRNKAFRNAIEKAVTPESIVLDVGAGQGLLSMMAARAGFTVTMYADSCFRGKSCCSLRKEQGTGSNNTGNSCNQ